MKRERSIGRFPIRSTATRLVALGALIAGPAHSHWPACDPAAESQTLSFVHISDVHANYNPDRSGGSPLARVRGFYERVKAENPFTLFTDAGDDYEKGSIAEALSQGESTRRAVQAMGYDVRTIGNHDFAWGLDELLAFSRDPTGVVLASNIRMTEPRDEQKPGWTDYAELTVGCLKVGFFGLVSQPWNEKDEQFGGNYFPELAADFDFAAQAREMVARHRDQVDLLVLVSHLGIHEDIRLARTVEGIDLILGGHTHSLLPQPAQVGATRIVHTGDHAERIGRLDLHFDLKQRTIAGETFALVPNGPESGLPADPAVELALQEILSPYRDAIEKEFAWVGAPLSREGVARIAARAAVEHLDVDAALVAIRTAWSGWGPGPLTRQRVLDSLKVEREPVGTPGFSSLYRLELRGAELLRVKEALHEMAYAGPARIDPARRYTLALQKPQALDQTHYFGRPIGLGAPEPAAELWEVVAALGEARSAERLAIDADRPEEGDLIALLPRAAKQEEEEAVGMQ